jgi:drug/metabolite transporter (DMT)-like permease
MTDRTTTINRPLAVPRTASWGVGLAGAAALISGLAIYLNAFAVKQVPDAAVYTTLKNGLAAIVVLVLAAPLVRRRELTASRASWMALVVIGIVGGGMAFLLFFSGLAIASAPSAAFIQKTLFVWVAILAVPFLGERLGLVQLVALGFLVVGQAIVLPPKGIAWGTGETMILVATLLWAVEVALLRRFARDLPLGVVAVGRLGIGLVVLLGYVALTGRLGGIASLPLEGWGWVALTGVILAGYVATWFAALQRAPASVVSSILVAGAVITGALQAASKGAPPAADVVIGYLLIAAAVGTVAIAQLRARPPAVGHAVSPVTSEA